MIPESFIEQWRKEAPWQTLAMVEQDLVISRALIELYNQPVIAEELVFRGGTALNKLYVKPAARYSEDIDFVQIKANPIGDIISYIRNVLDYWLGEPKRKFTERSTKLIYRYQSIDNTPAKLKIEINTTEHLHVLPLQKFDYSMDSEWYKGKTKILTYELDELMGTKLRALFQRRKGRDLFDLWLMLNKQLINVNQVIDIFTQYCQHNGELITQHAFEKNLKEKEQHNDFLADIAILLNSDVNWNMDQAFEMVRKQIIEKMGNSKRA